MLTISEIDYLLDLINEIREGVDEGVLHELDNAEELLEGVKQSLKPKVDSVDE